MAPQPGLSADQLDAFERDGVLVLPDLYSTEQCRAIQDRMAKLLTEIDPGPAATVFSSRDQTHGQDHYFMTSGDKIRLFFERDALGPDGTPTVPLERAINKVGHALHDLDPVFDQFSRAPAMAGVAGALGIVEPQLLQSMYLFKQPWIGAEVNWHTDHTFLWTEPQSVIGFWVALEQATEENGCLWCLPGKHRLPVKSRFRRRGTGAELEVFDRQPYDSTGAIPLPAEVGTVVVLHGSLPHWSAPNTSNRSRHAYTL
ncbi:MAG: phytanoyl-CoA dioxygenase family protein, partial [Acidimicrobiia bacterium]|nr:phytanoyl-CoA dioxygenase family protein [Acidimicrobiia bacterium]